MRKFSISKALGFSLVLIIIIEIIFLVMGLLFGWFIVYCKNGAICGSQLEGYLYYSTYTVIPLFILVFATHLLYQVFKSTKKN